MLALTAALNRLTGSFSVAAQFPEPPHLYFRYEQDRCPHCGAALKVLKTQTRRPCTLHLGRFVAHETVLYCPRCPGSPVFCSEELAALVGSGRTFGYDIMVEVGEQVFRGCRTLDQTVAALAERHVTISPSEVRDLAGRFIISLSLAHAGASGRLRQHLRAAGGYLLHVDSTCKGASAHLLTGIDEISGLVLLNAKVNSESQEPLAAWLRALVKRFGRPLAVTCDMSKGILAALAEVLDGTPVFICHFHFLRDLGKDLLAPDYATVRDRLRHHGPKAELKRLQRELREVMHANAESLEALLQAAQTPSPLPSPVPPLPYAAVVGAVVGSILEAEHQADGCGFPFDRPHLLFFRQAQTGLTAAKALLDLAELDAPDRKLLQRLVNLLQPMCSDSGLGAAADALESKSKVFDRLRTAMRIAEPGARKGLNDDGHDLPIGTIERNVNRFCDRLRADATLMARPEFRAMLEQIEAYRGRLFADPIHVQTALGRRTIHPQRTNNILERFFRRLNRQGRKRTGQQPGEAFLNHILPDTPLVANLDNPRYVELLLGDDKTLVESLSRVDQELVDATMAELRKPETGLERRVRNRLRSRTTPLEIVLFILKRVA
ncbi:MAG: Transposase [Actinomycetota bacterium]|nr:Transposase [Actinomycetota bacterium]